MPAVTVALLIVAGALVLAPWTAASAQTLSGVPAGAHAAGLAGAHAAAPAAVPTVPATSIAQYRPSTSEMGRKCWWPRSP